MDLYSYVSIESFIQGCENQRTPRTFNLRVPNLMYSLPDEEIKYGLSLLRRSIVLHEEQKGIREEDRKCEIPFFRTNRRMLIGPEMEMYAFSLYQSDTLPLGLKTGQSPYIRLTFDYVALGKYCLSDNKYFLQCKYNEKENLKIFVSQMDQEYDKFFYDEEHTGFKRDSRFFSMLCNACLEVKAPCFAADGEWRIVQFYEPSAAEYDFIDGKLIPYVDYSIPFDCLRLVTLQNRAENSITYSALAGFLQKMGLAPERYLDGMQEE